MAVFKNKITGKIVEETLIYYVQKLESDSNYERVKEEKEIKKEIKVKEWFYDSLYNKRLLFYYF